MKGGVGKTTIAAHMSRELHKNKKLSTLLVDLDPQFNLTQQLVNEVTYEQHLVAGRSIMRAFEPAPAQNFFDINTTDDAPPTARSISTVLYHFPTLKDKTLSLIPGSFDLTKFSLIPDADKLKHAHAHFKRFISAARKDFDFIILDMNPSSSFLTAAGLAVATDILAPVRPDKYSILGLRLVKRLVEHPSFQNKPNIHAVMNVKSRTSPITQIEKDIRVDDYFGDRLFSNRIYYSGLLEARSDYTGFASDKKVKNRLTVADDLKLLANELCEKVGL